MSFAILCAVVLLDQASKYLVRSNLSLEESRPIVNGVLHLTHHSNFGAAFGLLNHSTPFLTVISVCFIAFMSYYLLRGKAAGSRRTAYVLILAGAVGNAIDRICFGYVIDFIDVRVWPIFNVADSAITLGFLIILVEVARRGFKT